MINIDSFMDLPDDMPDSIVEAGIRCRMGLARIYGGLELLKNGEKMAKDAGSTAHTARCHREVGRINMARGQIESAVTHLAQTLETAGDTREPFGCEYLVTYGEAKILT